MRLVLPRLRAEVLDIRLLCPPQAAVVPPQFACAPQHGCGDCIGGQTTVPYEQNTQQ
jgi:hypothetical protein